jgi:hypothetical protein
MALAGLPALARRHTTCSVPPMARKPASVGGGSLARPPPRWGTSGNVSCARACAFGAARPSSPRRGVPPERGFCQGVCQGVGQTFLPLGRGPTGAFPPWLDRHASNSHLLSRGDPFLSYNRRALASSRGAGRLPARAASMSLRSRAMRACRSARARCEHVAPLARDVEVWRGCEARARGSLLSVQTTTLQPPEGVRKAVLYGSASSRARGTIAEVAGNPPVPTIALRAAHLYPPV